MTQVEQLKLSGQLPTPRGVALAVLEISQRENATLGAIARVVQTDPALSGRLIKLANTASHISRPVVSVQDVVVRLGMTTVRQLALGFSLLDQYRSGACQAFDYQGYWSHSLLMALAMQALGRRVHVAAADELFVCGLLAQVGQLALATAYPDEYSAVLMAHHADPDASNHRPGARPSGNRPHRTWHRHDVATGACPRSSPGRSPTMNIRISRAIPRIRAPTA